MSHVHDGDTVRVVAPVGEAGGVYEVTCRLAGIDAPELRNNTSARNKLVAMLAETHNNVWCHFGKRDKYGRILVVLYSGEHGPDGVSINQRMLDCGEATEYHGGKRSSTVQI